jgi:PIN domain nuclease of toxin-antitoxin system
VRLLLDTHAFIWIRERNPRISPIVDTLQASEVLVSIVSAWEVAIKRALNKLMLPASFESGLTDSRFGLLPISLSHAEQVGDLPLHHRDPFDRMLIAQCRVENLTLVTADRRLAPYGVPTLWI